MKKHLITVLVSNKSGVLTRISGLFARRGFNIDSLVVCSTEDEHVSRMTIVVTADDTVIAQVIKQLGKLIDVIRITELDPEKSVSRELMMIKIHVAATQRSEIETTCTIYKAEIIDLSPESVIIELTGKSSKLDAFIELVKPYGIIEMTRTGLNALHRGKQSISSQ
ncbi:MAG: acetolactate synthase small subunit [Firmicutes bacterium]|nr:acetolactate synthase small subunit [Bacillota bacterium]